MCHCYWGMRTQCARVCLCARLCVHNYMCEVGSSRPSQHSWAGSVINCGVTIISIFFDLTTIRGVVDSDEPGFFQFFLSEIFVFIDMMKFRVFFSLHILNRGRACMPRANFIRMLTKWHLIAHSLCLLMKGAQLFWHINLIFRSVVSALSLHLL